jgi:hypothetical protein
MSAKLSITYSASRDLLGLVSEEEYQRFKDQLLEAFQAEWPEAAVVIDDEEEAALELEGISGQAEQDVRDRIEDIVSETIESGDWEDEDDDLYEDEDEVDDEEEEDQY